MRRTLARSLLVLSGLPSLPPPRFDERTEALLEPLADRIEAGDAAGLVDSPAPLVEFLRWLAERRPLLFHGSAESDLRVLEPIRRSRDTTAFGDQQAVFATADPVWAIYFAVLRRGRGFGTRNGSMGLTASSVYPRWYFFSVNRRPSSDTFMSGSLYVVPRAPFAPEPAYLGLLDTGQWVSPSAVRPLVRIDVRPTDFPFRDAVVTHRDREPMFVTRLRAAARARRRGRTIR